MNILSLFQRRHQEPAGELQLTVLYASAREGLSAEQCFTLRDIISASKPVDFFFLNPGSFEVFFMQTLSGSQAAANLAQNLRLHARLNNIPLFGVGIHSGTCLAESSPAGGLSGPPVGEAVSLAMKAAYSDAQNAL